MNDRATTDTAASIRARLLNHARQHGEDYQRILTRFAIERLLFRLSQTRAGEYYVLKGAMLFATWPENAFRPTGDLDLLGSGSTTPEVMTELFADICRVDAPKDGIVFKPETLRVDSVRDSDKYQGIRIRLKGELARAVIPVQIDIGFGDQVYPPPDRRIFPGLLPELPAANVLMYPPETVVAEKFEAIVRFGMANGRAKDYYDIWVTTYTFEFDLSSLTEAIIGTFRRRETAIPTQLPAGLTRPFAESVEERGLWTGFLRRNPPNLNPPKFEELLEELQRFFRPIISGLKLPEAANGQWDPIHRAWY